MKIIKTVRRKEPVEVQLKALLRLPSGSRRDHGMPMLCACCGMPIWEDYFLGGFADGHPNMIFHESCVADEDKRRLLRKVSRG